MDATPRRTSEQGFTLVELLVALALSSIIGGILVSTLMSQYRAEQYTSELQQVMDDGRISLDRVRRELRGGRRVYDTSTAHRLYWWTDQNQDGLPQPEERINYCVAPLDSTTCVTSVQSGRFRLIRWSDAEGGSSSGRTIAATLTSTDVFSGYAAEITHTRVVELTFDLDVEANGRGPEEITMGASVRLRNVA